MSRITGPVPTHVIELMDDATRAELGLKSRAESAALCTAANEKELQRQIGQFLMLCGIEFNVSAMHKTKTDKVGWPDFTLGVKPAGCDYAIAVAFEAKMPGHQPTDEQLHVISQLAVNGWYVRVVHGVEEVKFHLDRLAGLNPITPATFS